MSTRIIMLIEIATVKIIPLNTQNNRATHHYYLVVLYMDRVFHECIKSATEINTE